MQPSSYWARKRMRSLSVSLFVIVLIWFFVQLTQFDAVKGIMSIPKAASWAVSNFYPDAKSLEKLPGILDKLKSTILIAISSTTAAVLLALPLAVLGSETTSINRPLAVACRGFATIFRNIDVAAWAMILLFSFGQSDFTGYFALFFVTLGILTRILMETIDEVSGSAVEALTATGAGYLTIIARTVIPSILPQMISWILYMIETNIRSATLVGILTGTGIGFAFDLYYKSLNYNAASLVVLTIVVTILGIELVSNYIRRVIL